MKKITALLAIFLISLVSYAQDEVNTSFASQMNTIFGQLDKTKIPNGILLDYGMEFTNLPAYNGTLTDSTYSNATSLKQIYKTLLSSRITATTPAMVTPTEFETNWNANRSEGVIALSGVFYKYGQIIQNATTSNKITYTGGKFYDKKINNVWQNPYQVLQTFAMAPAIDQYDQLSFQVKLPSSLFYTNQSSSISTIAVDFDNGQGYQTLTMGQTITVSYTSTGMKTWKYKLNLTNGSMLYNQSKMQIGGDDGAFVSVPMPPKPVCEMCKTTATVTTSSGAKQLYGQSITATTAYLSGYGKVKITIDYAGDPNQGIKKPLIVAEGFDLGVILNPEKAYGSNTYSGTFVKSLIYSGSSLRNLIYEDYKQYDIIYVDWDNGVDYMQRNAYALEEVIKWVNAQKALSGSTTKNVVLGQSMGGVIARYALADMEQRGLDHQTSLFISHDAPQQGANIPISLQYMYRHLTKQYIQTGYAPAGIITMALLEDKVGVSNYLSILDAPASRQLLKNSINYDYSMNTIINTSFYDELKSKGLPNSGGYPILCRNIALSNGSECGETQNFLPGNDIVNFTYNKGLSFWGDLASLVYLPLGGAIGGTLLNPKLYGVAVLGSIPGHSKFNVNFISRALYNSAGSEIYKGKISYTKKVAWLFSVTINITNVSKTQPSDILPLDTYGGGYFDTKIIAGSVNIDGLYIRDRFGFIPTASALDIGKRNVVLDDTDYKKSYVGAIPLQTPKNSPFANYITDFDRNNPNVNKNKNHISFNSRSGDWLASELNSINNPNSTPQSANCSFMCSGGNATTEITGSSSLNSTTTGCGSSIYSIPNVTDIYRWSVTENSAYVTLTNTTTNGVTVTAIPGSQGNITLSLTYGSENCGYITITKRIWVGITSFNVTKTAENCASNDRFVTLTVTNTDTAHQYQYTFFDLPSGVICTNTMGNSFLFKVPITYASNYLTYGVRATLGCNIGEYHNYTPLPSCPRVNTLNSTTLRTAATTEETAIYRIYPNPSCETINISLFDENISPITTSKITSTLYDLNGQAKENITITNNNATLNVSRFKKGIYILKINIDGVTESHQVIVE